MLSNFHRKEAPIQGLAGFGGGVVRTGFSAAGEAYWITHTRVTGENLYTVDAVIDSTGNTYVSTEGTNYAYLYRLNKNGERDWVSQIRDPNVGSSTLYSLALVPGGNIISSAYMRGQDSMVEIDPSNGSLGFEKTFSGVFGLRRQSKIYTNSTDTYVLGGYNNETMYLVKLNNSGTTQWTRGMYSGATAKNMVTYGITENTISSSDFYMTYRNENGIGVEISRFNSSGSLINFSGTSYNTVQFSGYNSFYPYSTACDSSGNLYVCGGYLGSGWTGVLLKISPSGTLLWTRYENSSGYIMEDVNVDSEDNVYITTGTNPRALVWKFNSSGTLQWERGLKLSPSTSFSVEKIKVDSKDNLYLTGYGNITYGGSTASRDIVAKFAKDGSILGSFASGTFTWEDTPVNASFATSSFISLSLRNETLSTQSKPLTDNLDITAYDYSSGTQTTATKT